MIDCHLHLQAPQFQCDLESIMATVRGAGVSRMVVNGTHPGDWGRVEDLAMRFPFVIPSFGLHPWRVNEVGNDWSEALEILLLRNPLAGVGEIGLDKWIRGGDFNRQREVFERQLEIAARLLRPTSIHCLQAWGSLRKSLAQWSKPGGWLIHSYGGPIELVGDFVEMGAYFSLSGYFFREDKKAKLSLFESIPDERILLETDAPDMLPPAELIRYPLGLRIADEAVNHPANLVCIYEAYASWRGIPTAEAVKRMRKNFQAWYFREERSRFAKPVNEFGTPG